MDPLSIGILILVALVGFTIAGVTGFGGGVILIPFLIWLVGPKEAVPIVSVAASLAAISRLGLSWRQICWPVVGWMALGAVPFNALASYLFVLAPPAVLTRILGVLILFLVLYRHTPWGRTKSISSRQFFFVGAGTSIIDGFLGAPGPVRAPFLLAYGLTGAAYVGTSAIMVLIGQLPKVVVYGTNELMSSQVLVIGGLLGLVGFLASYLGSWVAKRASPRVFRLLIETMVLASGVLLIIRG
jgi:uncharacterized membrane protein YfcA